MADNQLDISSPEDVQQNYLLNGVAPGVDADTTNSLTTDPSRAVDWMGRHWYNWRMSLPSPTAKDAAMGMMPMGMAGILGGRLAAKASLPQLRIALEMEKAGVHPTNIWQSTGWFKDRDLNWKFEIQDPKHLFDPGGYAKSNSNMPKGHREMGNAALDAAVNHPELFDNYPEMRDLLFGLRTPEQMGNYWGDYSPGWGVRANMLHANSNTIGHELQHGVQSVEGFAGGTNTSSILDSLRTVGMNVDKPSPYEVGNAAYNNTAGEIEARNVGDRTAMSPSQRVAIPPWATAEQVKNPIYLHEGNIYVPVDHDPFSGLAETRRGLGRTESPANAKALQPIDYDPFAGGQ